MSIVTPNKVRRSGQTVAKKKIIHFPTIEDKLRMNRYKINRLQQNQNVVKKIRISSSSRKMELVRIGGVLYNSSRNSLIRSSSSSTAKRSTITGKGTSVIVSGKQRFVLANKGKKLRRLSSYKDDSSAIAALPNVKINHKNNIINKVKQRSIQILRNKMRKNNTPCLLFQKFGYCANHTKGKCSKLHDKKQVSLCRNFLQGKCLRDDCPLSHDVGPEKMPTCKYFLEGCCVRDNCPYLHVKVSANTPVCIQFLRGYCANGNECKLRHAHVCPDYDKTGKCPKGKYCPYPHKSRRRSKTFARKRFPSKATSPAKRDDGKAADSWETGRYYEKLDARTLAEKRECILRKIELAKCALSGDTPDVEMQESNLDECRRPKRPPIGPLPAYIPID